MGIVLQPLEASDMISKKDLEKSQPLASESQLSNSQAGDPMGQSQESFSQSQTGSPGKKTDPKKTSFKIKSRPGSNQGAPGGRPSLKKVDRDLVSKKGVDPSKEAGLRRPSGMNTSSGARPKIDRKLDTLASTTNLRMAQIAEEKSEGKEHQWVQGMKIKNHLDLKGSFNKRLKTVSLLKSVPFEDEEIFVTRFS